MKPVLIDLGMIELQSYGVSALAALVAGWLLKRELARRGKPIDAAFPVAIAALVGAPPRRHRPLARGATP